ncbi:MAG: hypothetical protein PHS85_01935 [Sulfurovum sp.]|jgi:sensor domain CHASE-containing protein|nr:hypothetical protein [Sulfurovum sp.]
MVDKKIIYMFLMFFTMLFVAIALVYLVLHSAKEVEDEQTKTKAKSFQEWNKPMNVDTSKEQNAGGRQW